MGSAFSWERPPFSACPNCKREDFGLLAAGGTQLTSRCRNCRYSHTERLPNLDKKVVYLDQFAFSALFQIETKGRDLGKHQSFWEEAHRLLRRVVLLQQIILPHSDVHHSETVVSPFAKALREYYERFGGDGCLEDSDAVQLSQVLEYAAAFISDREPSIPFDPSFVLRRDRNRWLEDMHLSVDMDYSQFKDSTWESVQRVSTAMESLIEQWSKEKLTFEDALEREQSAFGSSRRDTILSLAEQAEHALAAGDMMAVLNITMHPIHTELSMLRQQFKKAGVEEAELNKAVFDFWDWSRNREQPTAQIFSYLLAALARKVGSGQRKVTPGFLNDVRAISTYAPFVDAMFLDNECASLLSEAPLQKELQYRAKIFSLNTQDDFLAYLQNIEQETPEEVRNYAARIYGIS